MDKQEETMQEFITMKELSELLKVCRKTAYRFAIAKGVRIFRDGSIVRFVKKDVLETIER